MNGISFDSLDEVDPELAAKVREAIVAAFLASARLSSALAPAVADAVRLEVRRGEVRMALADLGDVVASWDGSEEHLVDFARERGQGYGETYREDRARYGQARWG